MHNLTGDVGSTNVTVCDADGDGLLEIAVGALNLVFAEPRHEALLYCFEHYLGLRYDPRPVPDGHFAVASLPDRREKLACFLSSMRDGGPRPAPVRASGLSVSIPAKRWRKRPSRAAGFPARPSPVILTGTAHPNIL